MKKTTSQPPASHSRSRDAETLFGVSNFKSHGGTKVSGPSRASLAFVEFALAQEDNKMVAVRTLDTGCAGSGLGSWTLTVAELRALADGQPARPAGDGQTVCRDSGGWGRGGRWSSPVSSMLQ